MSRIQRIPTKQGHPVPRTALPTQGPFPRELFASSPVITEYEQISGNGGPEVPFGSTAQNNFKPLKWVKCTTCSSLVRDDRKEEHECQSPLNTAFYEQYDLEYEDWDEDDEDFDDDDDEYSTGRSY